jgi:four helix bundle protein
MKIKSYKDLKVWQLGMEIVDKVYRLTAKFPREELYGLTLHMRKSAVSIPSNISEGFVRRNRKEYRHFLEISLGSCAELDTQSIISYRSKHITSAGLSDLAEDIDHEMRMLARLIGKLSGGDKSGYIEGRGPKAE